MTQPFPEETKGDVWFVYDGDCPICDMAAQALEIKRTVGALHLVNARDGQDHPILREIEARRLDLDDGMVLRFQDRLYHGQDALCMMALLGSGQGWFNRMNAVLFRSRTLARLCYPGMRAARNLLLRILRIEKIRNLDRAPKEPIFRAIFGAGWDDMPPLMRRRYAVRPDSDDRVRVEGTLDVQISPLIRLMSRLTGALLAHSGKDVPVSVEFRSGRGSHAFHFDRTFHFPGKAPVKFHSRMEPLGGDELVEFVFLGIGWRVAFSWDGTKVILDHRGYIWRILGVRIPVPLELVIGRGYAEELPLSHDSFSMWTHAVSPIFGKTFGYAGNFTVTEVACGES